MKWTCPYCDHIANHDDAARVQHNCAARDGEMVDMQSLTQTDAYRLLCANCRRDCLVPADEIPDGEVWICKTCRTGGTDLGPVTYYQVPD